MTALLTWLARCRQLAGAQGLAVRDRHVNIVLGACREGLGLRQGRPHDEGAGPATSLHWLAGLPARRHKLQCMPPPTLFDHTRVVPGGPASEALREELLTALTSGASSLPAFQRLIPTRLDPTDGEPTGVPAGVPAGGPGSQPAMPAEACSCRAHRRASTPPCTAAVSTSDANHIYVSTAALFGALERA